MIRICDSSALQLENLVALIAHFQVHVCSFVLTGPESSLLPLTVTTGSCSKEVIVDYIVYIEVEQVTRTFTMSKAPKVLTVTLASTVDVGIFWSL